MPLVNIDYFEPTDSKVLALMFERIRTKGARALGCTTDNIWVTFHPRRAEEKINTHPPVVFIKALKGRPPEMREGFVKTVELAVAECLSVPKKDIWIHYEEMLPEDVWFKSKWSKS